MTLQYFLPGMCACTASDGTSARPRKHSLVYVSAAAERRDDGIEHTVVYKLLGLGACASHSFSISRPTASFRVGVCSFFFPVRIGRSSLMVQVGPPMAYLRKVAVRKGPHIDCHVLGAFEKGHQLLLFVSLLNVREGTQIQTLKQTSPV